MAQEAAQPDLGANTPRFQKPKSLTAKSPDAHQVQGLVDLQSAHLLPPDRSVSTATKDLHSSLCSPHTGPSFPSPPRITLWISPKFRMEAWGLVPSTSPWALLWRCSGCLVFLICLSTTCCFWSIRSALCVTLAPHGPSNVLCSGSPL